MALKVRRRDLGSAPCRHQLSRKERASSRFGSSHIFYDSRNATDSHVSVSHVANHVSIRSLKFGISYHEIVTKLVMEEGVLSEAESRLVLLLLSEPEEGHGSGAGAGAGGGGLDEQRKELLAAQKQMLDAVVAIETNDINKHTVRGGDALAHSITILVPCLVMFSELLNSVLDCTTPLSGGGCRFR
jgi:hypothetical protein